MPAPAASFDEIRAVAAALPAVDSVVSGEARLRLDAIAAAEGRTGGLGALAIWLAEAQRRASPRIARPRLALFAATHGLAADRPDGTAEALGRRIASLVDGGGILHRLVEAADADLRLYELALERPCRDSRIGPAMDEAEAARAVAYGMIAVEPGVDLLLVSALGIGAELAAAAIGRRAGTGDALELLAALGGPDIAAMLGTILAARLAGVPVILDGAAALAAASLAQGLRGDAIAHCRAAASDASVAAFGAAPPLDSVLGFAIDPPLAGAASIPLLRAAAQLF